MDAKSTGVLMLSYEYDNRATTKTADWPYYLANGRVHFVSHVSQNGKNGEPNPKGSDAIDDDDDERIVQTLLVEAVERRQRPHHALTQRQ